MRFNLHLRRNDLITAMTLPLATRLALPLCVCGLLLVQPVAADLTLSGRSTIAAMGMPNISQETLYLDGKRLRRDLRDRGRLYSWLYDLDSGEGTYIDHFLRQAEVRKLEPAGNPTKAEVLVKDLDMEVKATGRKHELEKWSCQENAVTARMPVELGNEKLTAVVSGQVWLAANARERKEVKPFLAFLQSQAYLQSPGGQLKLPENQLAGMNEMLRRLLPRGMLCAADLQVQYEGQGRMADLGRRMATRLSLGYETLSDAPLGDGVFAIPAGYRVLRP